jgi:hypothetical protein
VRSHAEPDALVGAAQETLKRAAMMAKLRPEKKRERKANERLPIRDL